jgi:UDP-N-acetylmuramate dehydrogenase
MNALEHELRERFSARLHCDYPLAELTSFRIGGPADFFLTVENEDELAATMAAAWRNSIVVFCLGSGTNLLVSDRGIRGLVLRLGEGFVRTEIEGVNVRAGAAALFGEVARMTAQRGLAGLEFGEGIPGSVGGALVMNAGAFGGELAFVVTSVHGVDREGRRCALDPREVGFAYRRTVLRPGFVITRVDNRLVPGDREKLLARIDEIHRKRVSRQPAGLPNAGSVFKNPTGGFAGRLLQDAGMKGERCGGAAFSTQHANFIVNLGSARAAEVRELIELARGRVFAQSGVELEPEVRLVGDWPAE